MARLTNVYRTEDLRYVKVGRRQLPVVAGDNLMMLMDLNNKGLSIDSPLIKGKELEEFTRKFNLLTIDELRDSLEIDSTEFLSVLNQCVQCVGCRRSVERLFYQLSLSGYPAVDPLILKNPCALTVDEEKIKSPQLLGTLLYKHHDVLNNLVENKLRNKTRCILHSLDAFRTKPFSETWREIWTSMKRNCRDELAVIETKELHDYLHGYLKKHKFCQGCRTKIEKAYNILIGETTSKDKGYIPSLFANIKKCLPDKHIHVLTKIDFLNSLIRRAEPEVNGSYSKQRERHAKTLEIAQEEVLTCVGMIVYERLRRVYISVKEEERACQVLAAVGVHALCRSFDMSVEKKQGISNLELLYKEISRVEKAKEYKRVQKKLKKKKKKVEKKNIFRMCEKAIFDDSKNLNQTSNETISLTNVVYVARKPNENESIFNVVCSNCNEHVLSCPCESDIDRYAKSQDAGYESQGTSRTSSVVNTPEGSEISCLDGFCNHDKVLSNCNDIENLEQEKIEKDQNTLYHHWNSLSLQQMLDNSSDIGDEENCYIPDEVVLKYQHQQEKVNQLRQQLRETLKQNFALLCVRKRLSCDFCK